MAVAGCGSAATHASRDTPPPARTVAEQTTTEPRTEPKTERERATPEHRRRAQPRPHHRAAPTAPGPPSDAQVRRELAKAMGLQQSGAGAPGTDELLHQATLHADGLVTPPAGAPRDVQEIIAGANQVARAPYVYGGGHGGHWVDSAYDCSGSVSFALANAGLLDHQLDSTALAHWGAPGRGKWVTIYANAGHAWMVVAGVRFDTSGRAEHGSRWQAAGRSTAGFTVRHPPGL